MTFGTPRIRRSSRNPFFFNSQDTRRDIYNRRQQNPRVLVALLESRRYTRKDTYTYTKGDRRNTWSMPRARSCGPRDATGVKFKGRGCSRENGRYARGRSSGGGRVTGRLIVRVLRADQLTECLATINTVYPINGYYAAVAEK